MLPTILSRCQTYDFNRIGISDMVRNLRSIADKEGVKVDDESLHVIAQKADGAMRDALTIFDQTVAFCGTDIKYADVIRNLGVLDYEYSFRLTDSFLAGDYAAALLEFDDILSKGFNALHFISALGEHFRNLLVARTGGLDSLLDLPESLKQRYREQGAKCGVKFIYDALGITTACEAGYKASTNQRLHIEYALMKLAFLVNAPAATVSAAGSPVAAAGDVPSKTAATLGTLRGRGPAPLGGVERSETVLEGTPQAAAPASVPAPAVAAEPKTPATVKADETEKVAEVREDADQLTPRKRSSRAKSVMSGLLSAEDENAAESKKASQAAAGTEDQIPSDDAVRAKWPELVAKCAAGKPRLQNALNGAQLTMEEAGGFKNVSFEVTNEAQKKWIEDGLLRNMETAFAGILGSGKVHLFVTVKPSEEIAHKVYMPAEKAQELMNANPEVMNLVKDLGLDAN